MDGWRIEAPAVLAVLAATIAACDCGRSHAPSADAAAADDAPVTVDASRDSPRYETTLACDDPELWSRVPTRSDGLEAPFECVPFHEPIHRFTLYFPAPPSTSGVWCWRITAVDAASGLSVGEVFETTDPSLDAYIIPAGDTPSVTLDARLQADDGSLLAAAGTYSAQRPSSAAVAGERAAERPIVLRRGHATASGGLLAPELPVAAETLLAAVDFGHSSPGIAWLDRRSSGLVLAIAALDYTLDSFRTFEVSIDEAPGTEPLLAGSAGLADAALAVVSGPQATIVHVDFGSPTTSPSIDTRTFDLDLAPEAVGVWEGRLLAAADGALVAWTLSGEPGPAHVSDLTAIVPGWISPWLVAGGTVGPPMLDATGAVVQGVGYAVDPAIGRPLAAGEDVLIGEAGLQRPPLDAGPTTVLSDDLFGGPIVSAVVSREWTFAVRDEDGTYRLHRTDPSFEGCD